VTFDTPPPVLTEEQLVKYDGFGKPSKFGQTPVKEEPKPSVTPVGGLNVSNSLLGIPDTATQQEQPLNGILTITPGSPLATKPVTYQEQPLNGILTITPGSPLATKPVTYQEQPLNGILTITPGSRMVTYKYDAVMEGRNGAYVDTAKTLSIRVGSVFSQANAKYNSDPALAEQRQKALLSREINKLRKEQAVLQDQLVAQYENDRSDQGGYAVQDYNTKQDFWQELLGRRNKNQTPTGVMTLASANTTSGNETDTDTGWMGNVNDIRNLFAGPGAPVGVGGGTSPLQKSTDENGWTDPNHHSQVEKDQAAEKLNKKQQEIKDAAKDTVVSGVAEFVPAPGEVGGVIKKVVVEVAKDKAKGGDGNPIDAGKKVIENSMDDVNKVFEGIKELWGMGIDKMRKLKERNKTQEQKDEEKKIENEEKAEKMRKNDKNLKEKNKGTMYSNGVPYEIYYDKDAQPVFIPEER